MVPVTAGTKGKLNKRCTSWVCSRNTLLRTNNINYPFLKGLLKMFFLFPSGGIWICYFHGGYDMLLFVSLFYFSTDTSGRGSSIPSLEVVGFHGGECMVVWRAVRWDKKLTLLENNKMSKSYRSSWWFQPVWRILVKLDHVPKDRGDVFFWNHHSEIVVNSKNSRFQFILSISDIHLRVAFSMYGVFAYL